ncbi:MAG: prepilin-type N-terminal cleavage/methylation domain-containing protein [Phycisphaerales bacterium]|nr:prepilin-type N-terminal cleavage/methylation domain-containing protein [Phycisphaerales bacterium]
MLRRSSRRFSAFTLIELLVVVAIIALLLSILLPALSRAREQGRIAVCTANLRSIAQAAAQYQLDGHDDLPWVVPGGTVQIPGRGTFNPSYYSEVVWGGALPDRDLNATPFSQTTGYPDQNGPLETGDNYIVPPRMRPMNKYLSSQVSWDNGNRDTNAAREQKKAEIPGFFKCPSDSMPAIPLVGFSNPPVNPDSSFSTWDWWGTSYPINWYWPYYYTQSQPAPYNDFLSVIGARAGAPPAGANRRGLGREMMKDKGGRWATEFVTFYENIMNYAMERAAPPGHNGAPWSGGAQRKQLMGWHGGKSLHVAAFLDGHASYQKFDTRFNYGAGWTTWPNKPWIPPWDAFNDIPPTDQNAN